MSVEAAVPVRGRSTLTAVSDAQAVLLAQLQPLAAERVPLPDAAGRILAGEVRAQHPLPGCDNSAMDGYAVCARDCIAPPVTLPVAGESQAGVTPPQHRSGTATRISTGAPLPSGADSVVPVEDTALHASGAVILHVAVSNGQNVRRAGEDARPGDRLLTVGHCMRAADVAVLAAAGSATVSVHRRPRVAIVTGGDELIDAGVAPLPHQVIDSSGPMLVAAVREAGGEPLPPVHAGDTHRAVREALLAAAARSDLVVSTAGVSVGGHDHVREVVAGDGDVLLWGVAMRPGKPLLIGRLRGTTIIGLPGNPVSSAVCFQLFARPAIRALQGASAPCELPFAVRMAEEVSTPRNLEVYLRVALSDSDGGVPHARLSGGQGSAMLRSLASADALAIVPAGTAEVEAGAVLTALLIR